MPSPASSARQPMTTTAPPFSSSASPTGNDEDHQHEQQWLRLSSTADLNSAINFERTDPAALRSGKTSSGRPPPLPLLRVAPPRQSAHASNNEDNPLTLTPRQASLTPSESYSLLATPLNSHVSDSTHCLPRLQSLRGHPTPPIQPHLSPPPQPRQVLFI